MRLTRIAAITLLGIVVTLTTSWNSFSHADDPIDEYADLYGTYYTTEQPDPGESLISITFDEDTVTHVFEDRTIVRNYYITGRLDSNPQLFLEMSGDYATPFFYRASFEYNGCCIKCVLDQTACKQDPCNATIGSDNATTDSGNESNGTPIDLYFLSALICLVILSVIFSSKTTNSDGERVHWWERLTYRKSLRGFQEPRYELPLLGSGERGMPTREYADSHNLTMKDAWKELREMERDGIVRRTGGGSSLRWFKKE